MSRMMYAVAGAALALAATQAVAQTLAKPRGDPSYWVSIDDASDAQQAKLNGQDFSIGFTINVGADGRPTGCTHRGQDALGKEFGDLSCAMAMRRARFTPATDASGAAVTGSWSGRSRWKGDGAY